MIKPASVEIQPIVQRGRIAAFAGDTHSARIHFRRAAELDPACAEAWLGLSGVVPVLAEKRDCLQHVWRWIRITPRPKPACAMSSSFWLEGCESRLRRATVDRLRAMPRRLL